MGLPPQETRLPFDEGIDQGGNVREERLEQALPMLRQNARSRVDDDDIDPFLA